MATNVRVDLDGADLRGADLNGADLGSAFLAGAYLAYADLGSAFLGAADLRNTNLAGANLADADLKGAKHLDLGSFIIHLPPKDRKEFLDSQKEFFDSLRPAEFAMFQLSPKTLAMLRREANGG